MARGQYRGWYGYKFLFFLVITKNLEAAANNFRRFFKRAAAGHAKGLTFLYYLAASFFLKEYSKKQQKINHVPLLGSFPHYRSDQEYDCQLLLEWIKDETEKLAFGFKPVCEISVEVIVFFLFIEFYLLFFFW